MSGLNCTLPSEPDVSGAGVRAAVYGQGIFCFVPPLLSLLDAKVSNSELSSAKTHATTNLVLAFTILISCVVQALNGRLSSYHSFIILSLSWMNNTNAFIYFLLYLKRVAQPACGSDCPKESQVPDTQLLSTWRKRVITRAKDFFSSVATGNFSKALTQIKRGSLHFTVMSALGIWLWSNPQAFGNPDAAGCAVEAAHVSILGAPVRFGSPALRTASIVIYSIFLLPGINLLLPAVPLLAFYDIYYKHLKLAYGRGSTQGSQTQSTSNGDLEPGLHATTRAPKRKIVLPTFVGLALLLSMNIALIIDIELTLQINRHMQDPGESEWGFGQTLAVLVAAFPTLRDVSEGLISKMREKLQKPNNQDLKDAIAKKNYSGILKCVEDGADSNLRTDDRTLALEVLIKDQQYSDMCLLVSLGVDLDARFSDVKIALEVATQYSKPDVVRFLAHWGADVNKPFSCGQTILQVACAVPGLDSDTVRVLLGSGANPNIQCQEKNTPLHQACHIGRVEIARLLIDHHADLEIRNDQGRTPLEIAQAHHEPDSEIVKLLKTSSFQRRVKHERTGAASN